MSIALLGLKIGDPSEKEGSSCTRLPNVLGSACLTYQHSAEFRCSPPDWRVRRLSQRKLFFVFDSSQTLRLKDKACILSFDITTLEFYPMFYNLPAVTFLELIFSL